MDGTGGPATPVISAPLIPGFQEFVPIGSGDFATVYSARESVMGREVAIKIFAAPAVSPDAKRRFERECKAIGALAENPNIVTLFGTGTTADGRLYVVMDLMTGGSLSDRLRRVGAVPAREVATVGVGLAAAIQAAHQAGVLHRDIDPNNVLISRYGRTQLADFGITPSPSTAEGGASHLTETIGYVAPEVIDGRPASPSSDVYSLAATLITMLTGKPPFAPKRVETLPALVARLHREPPPPIVALGASPELQSVLHRALEKAPELRFDSAAAFGAALAVVPEASSTGAPARSRAGLSRALPLDRAEETYPTSPVPAGPVPPPAGSYAEVAAPVEFAASPVDYTAPVETVAPVEFSAATAPVPAPSIPAPPPAPAYEDEFFSAAPVAAAAAPVTESFMPITSEPLAAEPLPTFLAEPMRPIGLDSPNGIPRPSLPSEPTADAFFNSPPPPITPAYVDGPTVPRTRALDNVDPAAGLPSAPVDYSRGFGYDEQRRRRLRIGALIALVVIVLAGGGVAFATKGHKKATTPPAPTGNTVVAGAPVTPSVSSSCLGLVCTFTSKVPAGSNETLQWVASNATKGVGTTFHATFKAAGAYSVVVTAVDGTKKSDPRTVKVALTSSTRTVSFVSGTKGSHTLTLTATSKATACRAGTAQLQRSTGSGWTNDGGAVKVPSSGVYHFAPSGYGTYRAVVAASAIANGTCAAHTSSSATTRAVSHSTTTTQTGSGDQSGSSNPPTGTGTTTPPVSNKPSPKKTAAPPPITAP